MKPERLDKVLAAQSTWSRKDVKELIRKGQVTVNGLLARQADQKIHWDRDQVEVGGKPLILRRHLYLMMNKPAGVVSAARDENCPTVVDLVPPELRRQGLFPAGRLDKDTTGLVIITDDGELAHRILAPKSHVPKVYLAGQSPYHRNGGRLFQRHPPGGGWYHPPGGVGGTGFGPGPGHPPGGDVSSD